MTLEERLRDLLGAEVATPPGYVERVIGALPAQSAPSPSRPLVALAAAALIVVAAAFALAVAGDRTPRLTPSPSPTASPTAPPPSPTPIPSLGAWTHVTFTSGSTDVFASTPAVSIRAGTVWPGGFLFVGEDTSGTIPTGIVWRSADGSSWTRTLVPAFDGTDVRGLVWTGQRLVVIAAAHPISGITPPAPPLGFAWSSTDGTTWTPVTDGTGSLAMTTPVGIGTGTAGVVIAGNGLRGVTLLHSSDGLVWTADNTSGAAFGAVRAVSVVGNEAGFVLSTYPRTDLLAPHAAPVFRSVDGIAWVAEPGPKDNPTIDLVAAGNHIVALGSCGLCHAEEEWATSDQGVTWRGPLLWMGPVTTSTDSRFVSLLPGGPHGPQLEWSSDGTDWRVPQPSGTEVGGFEGFLVAGNRVVIVSDPTGTVLVGQLH